MSDASLIPSRVPPLVHDLFKVMMEAIDEVPVVVGELQNPATCPLSFLRALAWGWGMKTWDEDQSEEVKRQRIGAWPEIAKRMGTIGAVRDGLAAFGLPVTLTEWFDQNPQSEPGTFCVEVDLDDEPLPSSTQRTMNQTVDITKKLSAHLTCFRFQTEITAPYRVGVFPKSGMVMTLPQMSEV